MSFDGILDLPSMIVRLTVASVAAVVFANEGLPILASVMSEGPFYGTYLAIRGVAEFALSLGTIGVGLIAAVGLAIIYLITEGGSAF